MISCTDLSKNSVSLPSVFLIFLCWFFDISSYFLCLLSTSHNLKTPRQEVSKTKLSRSGCSVGSACGAWSWLWQLSDEDQPMWGAPFSRLRVLNWIKSETVRQALDACINPSLFAGHYGRDVPSPCRFCHHDLPAMNDCKLQLWDLSFSPKLGYSIIATGNKTGSSFFFPNSFGSFWLGSSLFLVA